MSAQKTNYSELAQYYTPERQLLISGQTKLRYIIYGK